MHGENDTIVPPTYLLEAKEYLKKHGINVKLKCLKIVNIEYLLKVPVLV